MSDQYITQANGWAARYKTAHGEVLLPVVCWVLRKSETGTGDRIHGYTLQPDGMIALQSVEEALEAGTDPGFKGYVLIPAKSNKITCKCREHQAA